MNNWTEEEYEKFKQRQHEKRIKRLEERDKNRPSASPADLEPLARNEPVGTEKSPGHDTPCSIHVHSIRRRLADSDGISAKACIDGLVHAGILSNDTAKEVEEVSYSQEKGKSEKTIITISPHQKIG